MRQKKVVAAILAAAYLAAGATAVQAAMKCEVTKIDGDLVTVKCKAKDIAKLKVGKKVKVKK